MVLNPIERFKLHQEFNKNYKALKEIDKILGNLQLEYNQIAGEEIYQRMINVKTQHEFLMKHDNLLKRNTIILNSLYGGLK